ncbi:MAG: hypothetical protein K2M61_02245, partial [Muribaculaceae bacterium]|nr:hypothetical protein [Muribaculaceae bacterium]
IRLKYTNVRELNLTHGLRTLAVYGKNAPRAVCFSGKDLVGCREMRNFACNKYQTSAYVIIYCR